MTFVVKKLTENFFQAYFEAFSNTGRDPQVPGEMLLSSIDEEGYYQWRLLKGTLQQEDYVKVEHKFGVKFPKSFIEWHRAYYFLEGDCSILRLPFSSPARPMRELIEFLDWPLAEVLIKQNLYPVAFVGNDTGPLVFDGRWPIPDNEFPIRVYDYDYGGNPEGLSEVIFSSFPKLIECLTHYMNDIKERDRKEIIPEFFQIDPSGAGGPGIDYWLGWI